HDLHAIGMGLAERSRPREDAAEGQHHEADDDVGGMQPDEGIVRGAEEIGDDGQAVAVDETMPLPRGGSEEEAAQEHGDEEPEPRASYLPAMERFLAEGHGDAAGEEADRGEDGHGEHVLGVGAAQALADVEEVGDHEHTKERDLGDDQAQDADATTPGGGHGGGGGGGHPGPRSSV